MTQSKVHEYVLPHLNIPLQNQIINWNKERNNKTYCNSVTECIITHLRENLSFPVDTIPYMKATSWYYLHSISLRTTYKEDRKIFQKNNS